MTYQGYDVLTIEPNRDRDIVETVSRRLVLLESETGVRDWDEESPVPAPTRDFLWTAFGRQAIEELLAWVDERKGRVVPFWFPSWQRDLTLAAAVGSGAGTLSVEWQGYTEHLFAPLGARRHIAFHAAGVLHAHKVTAAVDAGATETLTLSPVTTQAFPVDTLVMFLTLCRLEEDFVDIEWRSGHIAEARVRVREIPWEAPL